MAPRDVAIRRFGIPAVRLFDILKPFPANRCEKFKGGLGVMADDLVAGIYANLAYRILALIF